MVTEKTNNKKTNNKKTNNKKTTIIVVIACVIVSISMLSVTLSYNQPSVNLPEPSVNLSGASGTMDNYIENLIDSHPIKVQTTPNFHLYVTPNDYERLQNNFPLLDGIRLTLNESNSGELINELKPSDGTVVVFPIFTASAYQMNGFYSYYGGNCDESCITDLSFDTFNFDYGGSGATAQILYHVGYDFLTDIQVDQNPSLLENYDTIILLHNEYVTKKEFDAISTHPNLIFVHPNALYAEIDVNYDNNTMTLIRGHQYPDESIANGFDYAIEEKFHKYEYDSACENWEFVEIENGYHLNCYPETIILETLEILKKLKELT